MRTIAVQLSFVVLILATFGAQGQDSPKANQADLQSEIARNYKSLESQLLKIAGKLERTGVRENVEKARVIYRALQEAREKDIAINLNQLSDTLKEPDLAKLKQAMEKGTVVKTDMEALLTALLSERSSKEHVEFLKNLIKELEKAIRDQKVAISKNQSSAVEKEDAKRAQEIAEKQVQKILAQIKEYEAKTAGKPDGKADDKQANAKGKGEGKGEGKGKGEGENKKDDANKESGDKKNDSDKEAKGKPGSGQGKPGEGEPKEGSGGGQSKPSDKDQEQQDAGIPKKRIQDAKDSQSKAGEKIDKNERTDALNDQEDAKTKLEQARKRLEEILRQMREEEIERVLADLQKRCEKMLQMQEIVYADSKRINQRIYSLGKPQREDELNSRRLSDEEDKIVTEADHAIAVIEAEGTAVAFTEVFHQVRNDMMQVSRRLGRVDVGTQTLGIEEDIITTLKEMIEALKKQQQEQRDKKQSEQNNGNPTPQDLIDKLAELRMIRSMQVRVNARTVKWGNSYQGEEARDPNIVQELNELAKRQLRIWNVTDNIAKGRNK